MIDLMQGDPILDPFIGIELEETYFNIAKERIEKTNPIDNFFGKE